jgi:hypothetical protein
MSDTVKDKSENSTTKKSSGNKPKVAKLVPPAKKKSAPAKTSEPNTDQVNAALEMLQNSMATEVELGNEGQSNTEPSKAPAVMEVDNSSKNLLIMFKPWCFKCKHLISTDEARAEELKNYGKDCHYMKGNENCPAKNNRLILGMSIEETARELYEATVTGNLEHDVKTRTRLAKYDPIIQQKVLLEYRKLISNNS